MVAPLVAVIVPAYNAEKFVAEAVESALAQTYEPTAIVVVDDGSRTPVADTIRRDPRLTVLRQPNRGPAASRNAGVRAVPAAKYVAFLDADDAWDPQKLEQQIDLLEADESLVAAGSLMRYVSSAGALLGTAGQPLAADDQARIASGELHPCQLSSVVVRRDALERIGGFDELPALVGCEDLDMLARLASTGRVAVVPRVLGAYRLHPESAMAMHRQRINRAARFVRKRIAERRAGRELTWETFASSEQVSWASRRRDAVERCYRGAALWYGERRRARALAYALGALAIDPWYTLRRVYRQRVGLRPATLAKART